MIQGEESILARLKKAEEILEGQRRRLHMKDQEILAYQRKLELALFVPQMGGVFVGAALPQGEAWDLSLPRVKSEYQELELDQRCSGMKRKYGGEATTSAGPALDISNSSMSTSSKEERFKTIKREEESTSWSPEGDFFNSSASTLSASKEEHSFEEQDVAIKKEHEASK